AVPIPFATDVGLVVARVSAGDWAFEVRDDEIAARQERADAIERETRPVHVERRLRLTTDERVAEERDTGRHDSGAARADEGPLPDALGARAPFPGPFGGTMSFASS